MTVRTRVRMLVGAVVVLHGLIHLLGAAKGLGWADVPALPEAISTVGGVIWLAAAALVTTAGVLLIVAARWWWLVGGVAAVVSQAVILTSWSDAKAGTLPNVVLLLAAGYGYASQARTGYRAEYHRRVQAVLSSPQPGLVVADADLAELPEPVAIYLRRCGAVGQDRVTNFQARIHGRIRSGADKPWMTFTGEQVNTYGPTPTRLFHLDASMFGLPVDVLHVFVGTSATMRVKLCSLLPMVNAAGPQMDRGETVTLFNDLCVLAPAALVDAHVRWQPIDDHHVRAAFTHGVHTVAAALAFNDDGDLVDFVSDDRLRASADGRRFTEQRWSTPLLDYRTIGDRRVPTHGEGRWHAPEPEAIFTYVEFHVDEITYNVGVAQPTSPGMLALRH